MQIKTIIHIIIIHIITINIALGATHNYLDPSNLLSSVPNSVNADTPSTLHIVNENDQTLNIFWKDYNGELVLYKNLSASESYHQSTYVTHSWVALDLSTNSVTHVFTVMEKEAIWVLLAVESNRNVNPSENLQVQEAEHNSDVVLIITLVSIILILLASSLLGFLMYRRIARKKKNNSAEQNTSDIMNSSESLPICDLIQNETTWKATCDFNKSLADELDMREGDLIEITSFFTDGWALGLNLRTNESGNVPLTLMVPARSEVPRKD